MKPLMWVVPRDRMGKVYQGLRRLGYELTCDLLVPCSGQFTFEAVSKEQVGVSLYVFFIYQRGCGV